MTIIFYVLAAVFAAVMLCGSIIVCGHDGEKENIIQYNYRNEDTKQ